MFKPFSISYADVAIYWYGRPLSGNAWLNQTRAALKIRVLVMAAIYIVARYPICNCGGIFQALRDLLIIMWLSQEERRQIFERSRLEFDFEKCPVVASDAAILVELSDLAKDKIALDRLVR